MSTRQVDRGTLFGALLAISGVVAGLLLDGGSLRQIVQPTAALIVLCGTLGAVMIQFPMSLLLETMRYVGHGLFESGRARAEMAEQVVGYCSRVRRHGMLALDAELEEIEDEFLCKALTLAVDGMNLEELREVMEVDLLQREEREEQIPRVLEAAGGFAPTLGIVGAVLGLIQVMQRLDNLGEIGRGIAVAFVSTLYGIAFANLLLLPLAGKLRIRIREQQVLREMILDAVIAMMEGISARALKERLEPYVLQRALKSQKLPEREMVTR